MDHGKLKAHVVNPLAKIHDEACRIPFWVLAGYFARDLAQSPVTVHETVVDRMKYPPTAYRPRLSPNPHVERTRTSVFHPNGDKEELDVPTNATLSDPHVERIKPWMYVWLVSPPQRRTAVLTAWGE